MIAVIQFTGLRGNFKTALCLYARASLAFSLIGQRGLFALENATESKGVSETSPRLDRQTKLATARSWKPPIARAAW
jgi:hypothetical protein